MQNYRDPPPYPGHSKQVFSNQPGFRQSFSGSETSTDVSLSSTENLATSQRQEPQGEETQSPFYSHLDFSGVDGSSSYSILARLGMPPGGLDSLGKPQQQQQPQNQQHHHHHQQLQQHSGISSPPASVGVSPGMQDPQCERYPTKNVHPSKTFTGGPTVDVLKDVSTHDPCPLTFPATSSSSVPSPLYSQGHLTVPQWQLGRGQGQGVAYSQNQNRVGDEGVRTAHCPTTSSSSPPSISSSRNPAEFSPSSSSSSSSSSTLTIMKRLGQGGGSAGEYSSYISSSSSLSSSSWSAARSGTSVSSAQGLPPRMADYASTPSSWSSSSHQYLSPRVAPVSTYHHPHPYVNTHFTVGSGDSTSSSHSSSAANLAGNASDMGSIIANSHSNNNSYNNINNSNNNIGVGGVSVLQQRQQQHKQHQLAQSGERSHSQTYSGLLPPPPEYPKNVLGSSSSSLSTPEKLGDIRPCRSFETMDHVADSRGSRPDLRLCASSPGIYVSQSPVRSTNTSCDETDQAAKVSQMVEMLTEENRALREELASATVKVTKLLKFEVEVQKVHVSHEAFLQSNQKREALWVAMKRKLEERIQALEAGNRAEGASSGQTNPSITELELRNKVAEKDALVARLLSQNQELSSSRRQLEAENNQLILKVAEQKSHVEIMDNALLNTQAKVLALEEEHLKKQASVEKVEQLQAALTSVQQASEKQEKREREMRQRLEKELENYKTGSTKKLDSTKDDEKSVSMLRKMLHEKDARIVQLETEIAGLEQKYVKEATLRQLKMDDSPQPFKEVRMAALEKSSSEMEKLIDEAKTEKLNHMEELHQSNRKMAELEAKVKQLQTQLVEKEAMVKLFQRSPLSLPRSSSLHALCHSSMHSPRPSLIASQVTEASGSSYRDLATIRHKKTESSSAIELGRKMSMEEDLLTKVQNLNVESKSDSEEEVKLWHV